MSQAATSDDSRPHCEGSDALFSPYLDARSPAERDRQLALLLTDAADPIIAAIVHTRQARGGDSAPPSSEADDIASEVREHLIRQITALHEGTREPIRDFRNYVASATFAAWAESLRARHPQRALLLKRLRYLLENRTARKGFALWADGGGARWCGLASSAGRPGKVSPKLQWLLVDPVAAVGDALGGMTAAGFGLSDLVVRILGWLGDPIELRDLTNALAELPGVAQAQATAPSDSHRALDPRPSPADELIWKEYLAWLWREIGTLSERQRRAFLLHADLLREMDSLGLASIRATAAALGLEPNELAELWNRLPLDDLAIAQMLGCTRQQVINLRRVARDRLAVAWREWRFGAGNMSDDSPSSR